MSKTLYRIPEEGMISGVCAGIAHHFELPLWLIRLLALVALFCGFFVISIAVYILMAFMLPIAPKQAGQYQQLQLKQLEQELADSEQRLRTLEHYLTSATFHTQSQFKRM